MTADLVHATLGHIYLNIGSFEALYRSHGEDGLLGDSEERGGAGEDEDEEAEEDVRGHVGGAQVRGQPGKEEGDEAADPLHQEQDDGGDPHPRVQAVTGPTGLYPQIETGGEILFLHITALIFLD